MSEYMAHIREDGEIQSVEEHLKGTAELAGKFAEKIGIGSWGEICGLLHDVGKYSDEFQKYIKDSNKENNSNFNQDEDEEFENPQMKRGKIDHSTAGAQFLSKKASEDPYEKIVEQIISLSLVSHHSGLIDCITTDNSGTYDSYSKRLLKADEKTHRKECESRVSAEITKKLEAFFSNKTIANQMKDTMRKILEYCPEKKSDAQIFQFQMGLLVRYLFSCLIDADRQNTADFMNPFAAEARQKSIYCSWEKLINRLDNRLCKFSVKNNVDKIRKEVSDQCFQAAERNQGIFTLTVPTGGGKTLASLRFALHHAKKYSLERIIYVIPFTSIIDQNAEVVRNILEPIEMPEDKGKIVLEHHSNIGAEAQTWKEKLLIENWDAPIVYTTMVQLLETLFGSGTRGARRMHQLAKSVIIFDEIQTLPVRCVHLFNNAINFLTNHCESSVVLCTATQPLLGNVGKEFGSLDLTPDREIIHDVNKLFSELKRVNAHDFRKSEGWTYQEIATLTVEQIEKNNSCLIVANTKKSSLATYNEVISINKSAEVFYLSTGMCPAHRKKILEIIREKLKNKKTIICVSTQLIEAGVDIDFGSVIRMIAGLDSIAQAAGRCNRNGERESGDFYIVNPVEENLSNLNDLAIGREKSNRVLDEYNNNINKYGADLLSPLLLKWYYENYFYERKDEMTYPVKIERNDSLLNMLSANILSVNEYGRTKGEKPAIFLRQSFMTAGKIFKAIDAPTQSVIVQYGNEGKELVNQLCAAFDLEKQYGLLKKAQQYSVNLFSQDFEKLSKQDALHPAQEGTSIFYLDKKFYSEQFGISFKPINSEELLYV